MSRAKRKQYPHHAATYEVREAVLDANEPLSHKMHGWLDVLCELRETLRQDRAADRVAGRQAKAAGATHRYLTKADQYRRISELAATSTSLRAVHSQVRQDVADRIHAGTQRWLKRKGGSLKLVPRKRYRSFTFTQYGFAVKIRGGRLHLSGLGEARLIGLRKLPGRVKSVRLVFKQGRWFAQFTCEVQRQHSERERRQQSLSVRALPDTGVDTGLARVATLADGTVLLPAKPLKTALPQLKREQRKMSRKFEARKREMARELARYRSAFVEKGLQGPLPNTRPAPLSNRLKRQIRRVALVHTKVENVRRDQLRKVARRIEQNYRLVAFEEHGLEFMRRNRRQARAVSDVAPGLFKSLLKHTLGEHRYVPVGTSRPGVGGNSQTCLCGGRAPKSLSERWHDCPDCGLSADRDTVSANIAMHIAFGYSTIEQAYSAPEPGQGFVRRGEGEEGSGQPTLACTSACATEPPGKRPSSRDRRSVPSKAGAQATARAKNPSLFGAKAPLSG